MVRPLKTINLVLASYSDVYCRSSRLLKLATSVFSSHKYFMNPELRAKQASYFYFFFTMQCYASVVYAVVMSTTSCECTCLGSAALAAAEAAAHSIDSYV